MREIDLSFNQLHYLGTMSVPEH